MAGIRMDAATLGAGWNTTLTWYAKAVREMKTRPISDRTSWWYLAAIHGFDQARWIADGLIKSTDPLPSASERSVWDQCQHQTWYFLPWHRGYLHAFEAIVAATVKALGGPANWALPYWNYLAAGSAALKMPTAFTARRLPDRSRNSMSTPPRTNTRLKRSAINLDAMREKRYTAATGTTAFGGGVTGFNHFGAFAQSGALELNPHNTVHVRIGGYMEDPNTAALDPIFWLHHCNVDRLWAAWLSRTGNVMENGKPFLDGPAPQFSMPGPDGNLHVFTPRDTMPGGPLAPVYDDLRDGTGAPPSGTALEDVSAEAAMPAKLSSEPPPAATLVGASSGKITVTDSAATAKVKLQPQAAEMAGLQGEERTFLNLENIRGTAPSASLVVRIGAAGKKASYSRSVALFGLAKASAAGGGHDGNGINVAVDITEIAAKLAGAGASLDQLDVRIEQEDAGPSPAPVTVERISIFKQPVE